MLEIDFVRKNMPEVVAKLARRGFQFDVEKFQSLDKLRGDTQKAAEASFAHQNVLAEKIAQAKRNGSDVSDLIAEGKVIRETAELQKLAMEDVAGRLTRFMEDIPNLPVDDVPDGASEAQNVPMRGYQQPADFSFKAKTHDDLGVKLNGIDFEAGAAMSGARFTVMHGQIARLHRALIQFMLDTHVDEHGYSEVQVPYLVGAGALFGTGQLPKFEEDLYKLERDGLYLIPTAEVPVTNLVANKVTPHAKLPLAFTCHTPCFRREAGSAGRDIKGLIRQHQFEKIELVRMCDPASAAEQFETLLSHAESILKKLELPYRAMRLCAGDMGFSAEKTVDLEVWLPGQAAWREISSVSSFGTFQARRMKARFKDAQGKNQLLCTLNGSGLAAGRTLVAVMENYQQADGSITVPKVLQRYMNGLKVICAAD